jgi:aryl-alcohol dehydrogenase-like predicted oxidoreductase
MRSLDVPVIGMGTASNTFDTPQLDDLRQEITTTALDMGATFMDSSPMYGNAERMLGQALAGRRDEAIIATKVWTADDDEAEQQIAASLAFFGGRVEVFQVHNLVEWPTRLDQLERRRAEGTVMLIGATEWQQTSFGELEKVMRTGRLDTIQIPYNPIQREVEARILPLAADLGLGVILMRPFAAGGLAQRSPSPAELAPFAAFGAASWAQVLLKYGLSHPATTVSIPATSKPERMAENAAAGDGPPFGDDERRLVERLVERVGA